VTSTYTLTLGMPHTNRRGFSETDLMKQAGHCLWQAISSALGQPLSALRTVGGGEVYAAFYYIETVIPEVASLETYQVDDTVKFTISLRAFKNLSIEARVRVNHAGSSIAALRATADKKDPAPHAADGLDIRFANIFITPLAGNSALKVAPPAGVDCAALPPLPNAENPFHLTRAAREAGHLELFDPGWLLHDTVSEHSYQIDRDRDTNGAGLVYFANYVAFGDLAERMLATGGGLDSGERSLRHRRIAFYGNADIDDVLTIRTVVLTRHDRPSQIGFRHTMTRQSDGALICLTEVVKATERAVRVE
jgi:probable biosynthetic protein (TIGR04098 family)